MDNDWDAPPEEDFDALLDDEDELEYIREMEMEQKKSQMKNIVNTLENTNQVRGYVYIPWNWISFKIGFLGVVLQWVS